MISYLRRGVNKKFNVFNGSLSKSRLQFRKFAGMPKEQVRINK